MHGFTEKNGVLYADDVKLTALAESYGTPTYIYSAATIRAQFALLKDTMAQTLPANRQPLLCYACKANSHLAVLSLLRGLGAGLEIVSHGELVRGLRAGFNPQHIVSTGVGKSRDEILDALKAGIRQFNVESLPELEHIDALAREAGKTADIVFRVNPDIRGGGHDKISTGNKENKFGLLPAAVRQGYAMAAKMKNIRARGLSTHIGSQVFDVAAFERMFHVLADFVRDLRKDGFTVERLDIGGGFPIRYRDEKLLDLKAYAEWVRDIIVPLDIDIVMEPGRFLVGDSGALLTRVLYVKNTGDKKFLVLDAAMNDMVRPAMYDAWHGIEPVTNRNTPRMVYDVVGPVCESSDIFAAAREMPAMKTGDLAVIRTTGAYGFCMASNYNTRPLPPEIFVDGARHVSIRPRQTFDEILKNETVPDWIA